MTYRTSAMRWWLVAVLVWVVTHLLGDVEAAPETW